MHIDYRLDVPIYEQICSSFELMIKCSALQPNDKMPSVRELAADLSINPNTVQKAMMLLESKGLIYTVKGRGSFVSDDISKLKQADYGCILQQIEDAIHRLKAMGFDPTQIKTSLLDILKKEAVL